MFWVLSKVRLTGSLLEGDAREKWNIQVSAVSGHRVGRPRSGKIQAGRGTGELLGTCKLHAHIHSIFAGLVMLISLVQAGRPYSPDSLGVGWGFAFWPTRHGQIDVRYSQAVTLFSCPSPSSSSYSPPLPSSPLLLFFFSVLIHSN